MREFARLGAPAEVLLLIAATAVALGVVAGFAPMRGSRRRFLASGLLGVGGLLVAAVVPDLGAIAVVVLALGAGQGSMAGRRPFAERMRGPAFAAALVVGGDILLHAAGGATTARVAALTLGLAIVAVGGLVPFLPALDPTERAAASPLAWTGFLSPVLATVLASRVEPQLPAAGVPVFGSLLIGLGLLNIVWGGLGAWLVEDDVAAWRYSFLADWGLALVGLGIVVNDGAAAAYLVLLSVLLVRVPLYAWSRPVILGHLERTPRPSRLVVAAVLAGAPPFAGFAARALLLRGAAGLYQPLAVVLALAMLLYLAQGFRLSRTVPVLEGRPAIGVVLALAAAILVGVVPAAVLAPAGL